MLSGWRYACWLSQNVWTFATGNEIGSMAAMTETVRTIRKTYQEKLRPTPAQECELERVLWRCRILYNTALAQRIFL